jgi:hypothetical protein
MLIVKTKAFTVLLLGILLFPLANILAQEEETVVFDYAEDNQKCFNCHGHATFTYYNEYADREIRDRMNPYFIIDSAMFYQSNHKTFACTDCHSYDYNNFPHSGELRMEEFPACIDCHGGDEEFAQYQFERIDEEFHNSVHSNKHSDDFTCWMCHNPHEYKINARNNANIQETILYDNEICMSCHTDLGKYQLIAYQADPNIIDQHEWLPNQAAHFLHVRCIECHTEIQEDMLVAHKVLPKEKAVKKCVECHSKNSMLMASLYKYQEREQRSKLGFFNAVILDDTYIIGANRNIYLNIISLVMFGMVIIGIGIHAFLRTIKK